MVGPFRATTFRGPDGPGAQQLLREPAAVLP
jgi:hypothetical protein